MEQQNELFGNLFGSINILSEEHLEVILSTMDREHAIYYLVESVKTAHNRGSFSIGESEVISNSIRILSRNDSVGE